MVVVVETLVWADFIRTLTTTSKMNNSNNVNNIKRRQRQLPFRKATEIQIVFVSLKLFCIDVIQFEFELSRMI